jgi:hypothetical protein
MPEPTDARVRPLRRLRPPGYPGHLDPDPTRHPYPVPYPFSSRMLVAAGSLGLVAALQSAAAQDAGGGAPPAEEQVQTEDGNPLGVSDIGVPYQPGPYGTGAPLGQLPEQLAREAIERVFAEQGYELTPNLAYDRDGVACRITAFDQERQVGYIYASDATLDRDEYPAEPWAPGGRPTYSGWTRPRPTPGPGQTIEEFRVRFLEGERRERALEALQIEDPDQRLAALRAILAERAAERLSDDEARTLEQRATETGEYIAIISHWDRRFELTENVRLGTYSSRAWQVARQYRDRAQRIADPTKRQRAIAAAEQRMQEAQQVDARESARLRQVAHRRATEAALRRLERAVREFLTWAESQGQ